MHIHPPVATGNVMAVPRSESVGKALAAGRVAATKQNLAVVAATFNGEAGSGEREGKGQSYGDRAGLRGGSAEDGSFARTFSVMV